MNKNDWDKESVKVILGNIGGLSSEAREVVERVVTVYQGDNVNAVNLTRQDVITLARGPLKQFGVEGTRTILAGIKTAVSNEFVVRDHR